MKRTTSTLEKTTDVKLCDSFYISISDARRFVSWGLKGEISLGEANKRAARRRGKSVHATWVLAAKHFPHPDECSLVTVGGGRYTQ